VFLHETVDEMAAAYLFHMARNHPFIDGNKRTVLMAMLAFLGLNGFRLVAPGDEVFDVVLGIPATGMSKAQAAVFIQKCRVRGRGILPGEDRP
jgi:death-on-curing protein